MVKAGALSGIVSVLTIAAMAFADTEVPAPTMSINDLMVTVVTPATNTLWGIEDPQSDAEWQVFIDAADTVINAGRTIKIGGTGPNDSTWASEDEWQSFADALINAGRVAREAAENRDLDAMFNAGDVLYPPCEECHNRFHPGVVGFQ